MDLFAQTKIKKENKKTTQTKQHNEHQNYDINPITEVVKNTDVYTGSKISRSKDIFDPDKFNIFTFLISCKELNKISKKPYIDILYIKNCKKIFINNEYFNDYLYYNNQYIILNTSDVELIYLVFYFKDFLIQNNIIGIMNYNTKILFDSEENISKYFIIKNDEMFLEFIKFNYIVENKRCFMCPFYLKNVCAISN